MNQHYTLKQELPDLDEWLNLRRLVGWHVYERTSAYITYDKAAGLLFSEL